MKPTVSVIVPIYNVESYLVKCLESIINQTYSSLEVILIDDGSLDKSGSICDDYRARDSRIKVIHKVNGGLSSARNAGMNIATGEYVLFVDSDDWIDNCMIEDMIKVAIDEVADIVQCGFRKIDENGVIKREFRPISEALVGNDIIMSNYFQQEKINVVVWNKLYRKQLFNKVRFIEKHLYEDIMLSFDILLQAKKIVTINEAYYNYLQRNGSIMSADFSPKKLDMIFAGKYVNEKCEKFYPEYSKYSSILVCMYCFYLFYEVNILEKRKNSNYKAIINKEFNYSFNKIIKSQEFKNTRIKNKILIKSFKLNKSLAIFIYKLYKFAVK